MASLHMGSGNYTNDLFRQLSERAEARVEYVQRMRELQITPQPNAPSYYEPYLGTSLDEYREHIGRGARSPSHDHVQQATIDALSEAYRRNLDRSIWDGMELDTMRVGFPSSFSAVWKEKMRESLYGQLLNRFSYEVVREERLSEKQDITNRDARFLLERTNE